MRDINRIDPFLIKLKTEWEKVPDWRFGQLMYNFFSWYGDPFYLEEDRFIEELRKFIDECK